MVNVIPAAPIAAHPVVIAGPTGPTGPSFTVTGMAAVEPAVMPATMSPLDELADLKRRVEALEAAFAIR